MWYLCIISVLETRVVKIVYLCMIQWNIFVGNASNRTWHRYNLADGFIATETMLLDIPTAKHKERACNQRLCFADYIAQCVCLRCGRSLCSLLVASSEWQHLLNDLAAGWSQQLPGKINAFCEFWHFHCLTLVLYVSSCMHGSMCLE